jgi:septum formation protein
MLRLASNSPTRADILSNFGIKFVQTPSSFDEEKIKTSSPKAFVYEATCGKFQSSLDEFGLDIPLLVADTVVSVGNEILRKAIDRADAKRLLKMQSGNSVKIITAMIYQSNNLKIIDISSTIYNFKTFENDKLENYLDSNLWQGKAGAIMVEGFAKEYIKKQIGFESSAMGLTIEKLLPFWEI